MGRSQPARPPTRPAPRRPTPRRPPMRSSRPSSGSARPPLARGPTRTPASARRPPTRCALARTWGPRQRGTVTLSPPPTPPPRSPDIPPPRPFSAVQRPSDHCAAHRPGRLSPHDGGARGGGACCDCRSLAGPPPPGPHPGPAAGRGPFWHGGGWDGDAGWGADAYLGVVAVRRAGGRARAPDTHPPPPSLARSRSSCACRPGMRTTPWQPPWRRPSRLRTARRTISSTDPRKSSRPSMACCGCASMTSTAKPWSR